MITSKSSPYPPPQPSLRPYKDRGTGNPDCSLLRREPKSEVIISCGIIRVINAGSLVINQSRPSKSFIPLSGRRHSGGPCESTKHLLPRLYKCPNRQSTPGHTVWLLSSSLYGMGYAMLAAVNLKTLMRVI